MPHILTIDLGTTLLKFAVFDERGALRALARVAPAIEYPAPGRWELGIEPFRRAIGEGIGMLRGQASLDGVSAVSFATQANSFTLFDAHDRPLCPIILWPDERAIDLAGAVGSVSAQAGFDDATGIPALGHQFAVAKLLWLARERPALFEARPRLLFISDLLTWWFTRRHACEAGVAGLSGGIDIHHPSWREDSRHELGLGAIELPEVVRAGTDLGPIVAETADALGLPRGCRFVVGCLDQYAGAIGTGTVEPGRVTETTGTVLAAVRCTRRPRSPAMPGVFAGPSFEAGRYFEMTFSSTSANLLEHYRRTLPDRPSFEALSLAAETADAGDLEIEPYVDGEPIERCFRHVRPQHTRGQVVRAIMEAVARQLGRQVRDLCGDARPDRIASAGGGARSELWLRIKREIVGVPCIATDCEEPTSRGAAILGNAAVTGRAVPTVAAEWLAGPSA